MDVGDELRLVSGPKLAQGGEAVARAEDGRVVFVRGGAPSETFVARIAHVARRFARADLIEVVAPGGARVSPPCPYVSSCGGCPMMHIEPRLGSQAKLAAGLETLARVGGVPVDGSSPVPLWSGPAAGGAWPAGGRTRTRLGVEGLRVGFRQARSHRIVPVDRCIALHPVLDHARARLARRIAELGGGPPGTEISLITNGEEVSVHLGAGWPDEARVRDRLGLSEDALMIEDRGGPQVVRADVFAQASLRGNDALLEAVQSMLPAGGAALELYAGSGNFTRLLARRFERVTAVESSSSAVDLGRGLSLVNVDWRATSAELGMDTSRDWDMVFVDPPRTGLSAEVRKRLVQRPPSHLIYVSCDVGTLARDAKVLGEAGLRPREIRAVDLFPWSAHLEWILRFSGGGG